MKKTNPSLAPGYDLRCFVPYFQPQFNYETGKLIGDLPASRGKLAALFGSVTAGVTVAAFLIGLMIGFF